MAQTLLLRAFTRLEEPPGPGRPRLPELVVQVKALACELPSQFGSPLSRWSLAELNDRSVNPGWWPKSAIALSGAGCMRMPSDLGFTVVDFSRDPQFAAKAARLLDLYERVWQGQPLQARVRHFGREKTSIQARARIHPTQAPQPGQPMKVERGRAARSAYLPGRLGCSSGELFGHCEPQSGIVLVAWSRVRISFLCQSAASFGSWTTVSSATAIHRRTRYPRCIWSMDPFTSWSLVNYFLLVKSAHASYCNP